jgi:predicted Zn-dependent protease
MFRVKLLFAVAVLLTAAIVPSFPKESREEQTGREFAKQFEEDNKLVTDAKVLERVNRIGQALAAVAKTHEVPTSYGSPDLANFDYQFKVVESDDINAFSLPGGIVYVYNGLIKFANSDDELAGVLAHEVAHAAHHHVMALTRKQSKMDVVIALITLAGGLSKMNRNDLVNVIYGAQSVRTARLTGYGREAECDADKTGVIYAHEAGYNPRGMLRFLDRLAQYQEQRGEVRNLGIFQTHPPSKERLALIAGQCTSIGVKVDRRETAHLAKAKAELTTINGRQLWTVMLAGRRVCIVADAEGITSKERAERASEAINKLLRDGLSPLDIRTNARTGELRGGGKVILKVTAADSSVSGMTPSAALAQAADAIRYALWSDWIKTEY